MRNYKIILSLLLMLFMGLSCDRQRSYPCDISITISPESKYDSISIFCYEEDYHKVREMYVGKVCGTTVIQENNNVDFSRVGYFQLDCDTICHYFILEPGKVDVKILKDWILVTGANSNRNLFELRKKIRGLQLARDVNYAKYLQGVNDSTMTCDYEQMAFSKDSVLANCIQKTLVKFISNGDAAARVVKEQYSKLLTKDSWSKIRKEH